MVRPVPAVRPLEYLRRPSLERHAPNPVPTRAGQAHGCPSSPIKALHLRLKPCRVLTAFFSFHRDDPLPTDALIGRSGSVLFFEE